MSLFRPQRRFWWSAWVVLLAATAAAQTTRRTTDIAALLAFPSFYHARPVTVVGTMSQAANGEFRIADDAGSVRVIPSGNAPDGLDEVRGEFWDLGRMKADDPRLIKYDLRAVFHIEPDGNWPRPGEVTALIASAIAPAPATSPQGPGAVPIRAIVLTPSRYLDQKVTIVGQYDGRNLSGFLPDAPAQSRYDFVLRSADSAIWVSNLRPKGKDARGRDFELMLDAKLDTGRWLQVAGTVKQRRGLIWIDGEPGSFSIATAPTDTPTEEREVVRIQAPAPEVVFSAPTEDETDVPPTTNIRIQFSRDLDPATLKGHIAVTYVDVPGGEPPQPVPASDFNAEYLPPNRVVELKFAKPLDRFRMLRIQIDGVLGTDQQPAKPFTLTFALGG